MRVPRRLREREPVAPAWAGMQRGQTSDDPFILVTQQLPQDGFSTMVHPETGELGA